MAINLMIYNHVLFPSLLIWWRISSPLIGTVLPVHKEVVHVHPGSGIQVDPRKQYPVLDFIGLVEQHGYDAEEYNVTTSDGYILRLHRISGGPSKPSAPGKPVIYIQHGIELSSDSWVLIGPKSDLAFLLVDAGYDVWLGNVRGNCYSRGHVWKDPNSASYWEFSFNEMGLYDVPVFIDTILNKTGAENLTYLGYSMGTTISYVMLSSLPEYNDKLNMVYSVAPVAYWRFNLRRLFKFFVNMFEPLKEFVAYFNMHQLLPQSALAAEMGKKFCGDDDIVTQQVCASLFCKIGLDCRRFNKTALPNIMAHFPAAASIQTYYHYYQNYEKETFQAYDYGAPTNLMKYGVEVPPYYNLTKVTAPVSIWYAEGDDIVNPKDAIGLTKSLPNVVSIHVVDYKKFNHFDFLWAKDVRKLFYDKLPMLTEYKHISNT